MIHTFIKKGNGVIRRCVPEHEQEQILRKCLSEPYGGHHAGDKTAHKVLQSGFYWPTLFKDARKFVLSCDTCQRIGNISRRPEMPMNQSLVVEPCEVWGVDYMGPFPTSNGYTHILVAVDYVTKWVEAIPTSSADHKTSIKMLKEVIFPRFGVPRYLMTMVVHILFMVLSVKCLLSMMLIIELHLLITHSLVVKQNE